MSRIIKDRERVETISHCLFFPHKEGVFTSGFAFDCDENGNVDEEKYKTDKPVAYENYLMCRREREGWQKVMTSRNAYWTSTVIRCDCGEEVHSHQPGEDADCEKCGRTYNSSGQLLAPRSQWGEETGETAADYDAGFNNPQRAFED